MREITFPNLINAKTGKTLVIEVPDEMYKDQEMHKLQDKLNESQTKVSQEERSKEH